MQWVLTQRIQTQRIHRGYFFMFKLLPRRFRHLATLTTFAFALQAASPWALAAAPNDHTPDYTLDHASAPARAADLVSAHAADPGPVYGAELQGYAYPAP